MIDRADYMHLAPIDELADALRLFYGNHEFRQCIVPG